jgi:uracil-DNA glycosylase
MSNNFLLDNFAVDETWHEVLDSLFKTPVLDSLSTFLQAEYDRGCIIYPKKDHIFRAFQLTPLNKVTVALIAQDPYHGPNQAEGLAFSVPRAVAIPPSLRNIFKELHTDLGLSIPSHGSLISWAQQGVLLLNTTLTVRASEPASHAQQGWEYFTDKVIEVLSARNQPMVFLLFGQHAQMKKSLIDTDKHKIIEAAHPSPFSAHRGFFGSKPFSATNTFLLDHKLPIIDWQIQ